MRAVGGCSRGFTLVEIMVALVIGMLGIVVMMQMFAMFEGQKRTTSGGDDAISGGSVALYDLQRDIQRSGWGTSAINIIGCNVAGLVAGGGSVPFVPVTINSSLIPAGDANTDTLLVVSGNGNATVEGAQLLAAAPAGATVYTVRAPMDFYDADTTDGLPVRVVAGVQTRVAGTCNLTSTNISAQPTASSVTVSVASGLATALAAGDRLFLLGDNPVVRVYAIRGGNLTVCDWRVNDCSAAANTSDGSVWVPVASGIVSLRAEYGRDTATAGMDGVLDVWDRSIPTTATPISTTAAKNMEACAIARIVSVRLALVARSSQPEKTADWPNLTQHVTPAAPLWEGSNLVAQAVNPTEAGVVAISLPSPDPSWPTWQDFRYKVFQTVVPLRNITSPGVPDEC